jgi:hypothetical protein
MREGRRRKTQQKLQEKKIKYLVEKWPCKSSLSCKIVKNTQSHNFKDKLAWLAG